MARIKRIFDNPEVVVRDPGSKDSLEQAIEIFNRRLEALGLFRRLREVESFEKPGDRRRRKLAASIKRCRARKNRRIVR